MLKKIRQAAIIPFHMYNLWLVSCSLLLSRKCLSSSIESGPVVELLSRSLSWPRTSPPFPKKTISLLVYKMEHAISLVDPVVCGRVTPTDMIVHWIGGRRVPCKMNSQTPQWMIMPPLAIKVLDSDLLSWRVVDQPILSGRWLSFCVFQVGSGWLAWRWHAALASWPPSIAYIAHQSTLPLCSLPWYWSVQLPCHCHPTGARLLIGQSQVLC